MKGVIFDWDGVVIDSSAEHKLAWEILSDEISRPLFAGHFKLGFGKKNEVIISEILRWSDDPPMIEKLAHRKESIYRALVQKRGAQILPGARELLVALRAESVPRAIGSSTPRENLEAIFSATGLGEFFDAVACGDDVVNGKPDPDVFLLAAQKLALTPADCLVIEDAHAGIEAAHRAGMPVLAVATTNPISQLGAATGALDSLVGAMPSLLREIHSLVSRG